jgi:prepilin-type N-terminal cleavage/methylation domain-containing protein
MRPSQRGFTFLELGIALAIVTVLMGALLMMRGFVEAARQQSALQLVVGIRDGARQWSKRNRGGLDYLSLPSNEGTTEDPPSGLPGISFERMRTAWGRATIAAHNVGSGCELSACMRIRAAVRDGAMCSDMRGIVVEWSGVQSGQTRCESGEPWTLVVVTQ